MPNGELATSIGATAANGLGDGGGSGFLIMLAFDSYRLRELRFFDGYFLMNEATLAVNGDAPYQSQTQDSGAGVYARRAHGSIAVVARSSNPLPGGELLIYTLHVEEWSGNTEPYLATPP